MSSVGEIQEVRGADLKDGRNVQEGRKVSLILFSLSVPFLRLYTSLISHSFSLACP
jgi:hypothetical protein